MDDTKTRIRNFFSHYAHSYSLNDETDIFSSGFVSSLVAIQLVAFLEKEFNIVIDNEDLDLDNFKSIQSISQMVTRKTGMPMALAYT